MRTPSSRVLPVCGVILAVIVTACGGGEGATPTPVPSGRTATAALTSTPAAGSTTVTVPTQTARPTGVPVPTVTAIPVPTGQFRLAIQSIPGYGLYPAFVSAKIHLDPMFDPLVGLDLKGQPSATNGVASSWESSPDGLKWTLKVRDGVTFHNGERATAKDLKHTLDLYMSSDLPLPGRTEPSTRGLYIASVDVPDDRTTVVTLKQLDVLFVLRFLTINGLGTSSGYLLSKTYWEAQGRDSAIKKPVGSGPYKYKSDLVNQEVIEEAWERPHWYYGTPKYRTAQFLIIPESSTRIALLRSGSAETADVPRNVIPDLRSAGFDIAENPGNKIERVNFHDQFQDLIPGYGKNPLANQKVRQALSIAIDRELLNKTFAYGLAQPTIAQLAPRDFAYKPYPVPKQDLAKAKSLLTEAGFPGGFELLMVQYNALPGTAEGPQMMEAIAVWWESLGIKVERRTADIVSYLPEIAKHRFSKPAATGTWLALLSGYTQGSPAGIKTALYRVTEDNALDQLTKDLANAKTLSEHTKLVQQISDFNVEKWIDCPLLFVGEVFAVRKGYGGDKWDMGKAAFSYNLNMILTGKA